MVLISTDTIYNSYNVFQLGEEADIEALNCLPSLNLIRSTTLHLPLNPLF